MKLGIVVNPTPLNNADNRTAWAAAAESIVAVLDTAGLTYGSDYKIDVTAASAQLAILAHDTVPLVRAVDPGAAIPWTPAGPSPDLQGPWDLTPSEPLAPAANMEGLEIQLTWEPGYRSNSLHRLGGECARYGYSFEASRTYALVIAQKRGMIRDYGVETAIRHFDRGYHWAADQLLDFGLNPAP